MLRTRQKKTINYILFILFLIFAAVQLNDNDGLHWFIIYFSVAALCVWSTFSKPPRMVLFVVLICLFFYACFHLSLFIDYLQTENKEEIFGEMTYEKPYLEGSREFMGLLLACIAVTYQLKK